MKPITVLAVLVASLSFFAKHSFETKEKLHLGSRPALNPALAGYQGESLKRYSFGLENAISGLLWVDLLQNASHKPVSSHKVSWEYAQVDAITTLDPNFTEAYSFGAIFLSVLRRDKLGGELLLKKWVKRFPNDWQANYMLGIHEFRELKHYPLAAKYVLKAASLPGCPKWINSLGIRLLSETGSWINAFKMAAKLYDEVDDEEARRRLADRMRSLNYNLQKRGWEQALAAYKKAHHSSPPSLEALRPYNEMQSRSLSSLFDPDTTSDNVAQIVSEHFFFRLDSKRLQIVPSDPSAVKDLEKVGIYQQGGT